MPRLARTKGLIVAALVWAVLATNASRALAQADEANAEVAAPAPEGSAGEASEDGSPEEENARAIETRTLPELLDAARRNYPSIEASDRAIDAARAQLREAEVSPFMQFNAEGAFTVVPNVGGTPVFSNDSQLNLGDRWGPATAIQVNGGIPLYTFGKLRNVRRAARQGVRAASAQRTLTVQELELDVRRAYFALQLALDVEQMIREGLGKLEQAAERLEERLEQGDADVDPMDRFRMQAAIAEVRGRASQAEYLRNASEAALTTLTGISEIRIPECPSAPLAFDLGPIAGYVDDLDQARPEGLQLEAAVSAREAQLALERARFFPDIALALEAGITYAPGRVNVSNPFIRDAGNTQTLGGALVARWSLDLWGTNLRVRRRQAELDQTRAQRRLALAGMELEVRESYERLRDAQRREEAYGQGERATRRWFVSALQAYQVGTLEPKQLIDAITAYFTNRFNHLQAVHDLNVAAARLDKATGERVVDPSRWGSSCEE